MTGPKHDRVVVDSNVLVSRLLLSGSTAGMAVRRATGEALLLISDATLEELADVLSRPRFDAYVRLGDRRAFIRHLMRIAQHVAIVSTITACRDPTDDKFLDVAINGRATALITGDRDLLALHPFRDLSIMTPAAYLGR